ncbi:NAD-dependent epimerase/dehydratase family protein [uncultured Culturomica sp.]|jgi:nucleoside-diphosphate-sugar epimerase|uniref:NAD-dependent epimerase/dehydratase family protein n=1 Tax=uncultured Culturomica sp. TaxID=1926654 RepID=UPI00033E1279|nr:NAD-dependent epimerase/dehydratase family protein [uncultured Culturomica sp.]CCZ10907.1 putative epimerase/dehydratase WbiG [Odoribacter sp. CAG:788]
MNILITGIHGFVGSNLVMALGKEHVLYGLDIVAPEKKGVLKTFSWKDVEAGQLPVVDVIIHLAGKAHDTKNTAQAQEYFDINTGLTKKIFDFFLASRTQKFIFFSSVKAAADFVVGDVLTEAVIPCPKGPYGESKIAAEDYILSQKEKWENRKQVYILRPCMIHGPGNKGNLNLLYNVVKKGLPWPLGDFENRRSFTSIDNLCYIIDGLIQKNVISGIYHIADDESLSTNELIEIMCNVMGKKPHIWKVNKGFMTGCARLGSVIHLPLNLERLQKLTENYVVSNAKIKAALEIDRMPVHAREGLEKTIRSFQ